MYELSESRDTQTEWSLSQSIGLVSIRHWYVELQLFVLTRFWARNSKRSSRPQPVEARARSHSPFRRSPRFEFKPSFAIWYLFNFLTDSQCHLQQLHVCLRTKNVTISWFRVWDLKSPNCFACNPTGGLVSLPPNLIKVISTSSMNKACIHFIWICNLRRAPKTVNFSTTSSSPSLPLQKKF